MTEVGSVSLENEMDIVLAHNQFLSVADYLGFTTVTQTTFAKAIVEVCREVIDKTNAGHFKIIVVDEKGKYSLSAQISFPIAAGIQDIEEGLLYAQNLVPFFKWIKGDTEHHIEMSIGIPRFVKLTSEKVSEMAAHFSKQPPATPYEALKKQNHPLQINNTEKEEQIRYSKYLNEKKNEFISIASHELKTPLTSIKAYTQFALRLSESECSPVVLPYLEKIDAQASKLQRLIQQLLDVATIESGNLDYTAEKVVLIDFINEMVGMLRIIIPNHTLHFNHDCSDKMVSVDRLRIEQVFMNLLNNAAKYSEPGTNIYITSSTTDSGMEQITIRDEGIGMQQENLENIFQKFFREIQAVGSYSGLGVGLYVARNIIEQHGGKIWAESEPGVGSSISFTLPVTAFTTDESLQAI